jgi:hypothetical protein
MGMTPTPTTGPGTTRTGAERSRMKAWRTTACGIESIVAAETRNQARSRTARSAFDANFQVRFTEVKARRAPEHDAWAEMDASNACWEESLLPAPAAPAKH